MSSHATSDGNSHKRTQEETFKRQSSSISAASDAPSLSSSSETKSLSKRPRRITMAGMIYDANHILERALDPNTSGLHPGLFDDDLLGIGFYTIWEAGLIFSGNIGTGIVFARNPTNGNWSAPAAVGLSGIGWGLMGGASRKTIVYLIYDYFTLQSMSGEHGAMLRAQAESSLFAWGRSAEASAVVSAKGMGTNLALSYGRGIFGGISVEGALCKGRNRINEQFYGRKISTAEILFSGKSLGVPDGTLLPQVYDKLRRLCDGLSIYTPPPEECLRVNEILPLVNQEGEEALKEEVIEFVKVPEELMSSPTVLLVDEFTTNEIEVTENMDIFAGLVDKEDQSRHRPHFGIPPPIKWPISFGYEEEDSKQYGSGTPPRDLEHC
ncbi:Las17-binding protein actin regulator [Nitzschia inconspicua]|uniref:Las17-binding protein actin regulator n=1 Tax=Nitzschia inconspicua TaxID=303405 RepID=A0A9K3Q4R9_9STRA|nr:Las17-binding protein actin regulator [Nitzschia inconspicua]